ncbi:hypothetical protein U9M48_003469 [Paspalum notatum var. saurae]|uniref:Uncharacterized protein n=1 Tax=Paspalum notatum var. saurae TaxID=547442 RepID=A0AAQ3SKM3_PASNO
MAAIQSMFQQQGLTFVMPEVRPPPVPSQWGMFAQMPFSPTAQASNPYQTPPLGSGQHGSEMFLRIWMSFVKAIEIENVDVL